MSESLSKDELESCMNALEYREVVIGYHGKRYHIEAYNQKYIIGLFEKKKYRIKSWREVIGKTDDDAFYHLMNDPLFDGEALKDIIDEIDWLES